MRILDRDMEKAAENTAAQTKRQALRDAWEQERQERRYAAQDRAAQKLGALRGGQQEHSARGVQQVRKWMAGDCAARLAALRAHGVYDRADALLQCAQGCLEQLALLERTAGESGVCREEAERLAAVYRAQAEG
ncbi:MAG: hypothetical protein IKM11_06120 [Oscillospiraceae bacterium]|nr:hypothetical protein [Oscillospiraceae bacterium]